MEPSSFSKLEKYTAQAPRYTSYPTAPHFVPIKAETHAQWITAITDEEPVSLYLHIPYCNKLCWFCGCHTKITHQYTQVTNYLDALCAEIELVAGLLARKQPVAHIHFGGGSPTLLESVDFARVMTMLRKHFSILPDAQIAIEIDPRTVNESKIASYARYGVNRVSIGVQDFDHDVQVAINRVQPFGCVYDAISLCREYGIGDISLDLVYGLPKQTQQKFEQTLEYSLLLNPSRVALFGYAHVPWKKKNMRLIHDGDLPDATLRHAMFSYATQYFSKGGYVPIGLDHFVKPTDSMAIAHRSHRLKRNFQGYTTDRSDTLLGFGASAISSFAQGYIQNEPEIESYRKLIHENTLATKRGLELDKNDRMRRTIIEQLMCYNETDLAKICRSYCMPESSFDAQLDQLSPMGQDKLITISNRKIRVNPTFPQAVRLACTAFDAYFAPQENQHAQIS